MSGAPEAGDEPWGIHELAAFHGVKRATIDQRRWRGRLPEPDGEISGAPYWWRSGIAAEPGQPESD